mmetsp:Transcript_473/g.567  ORF Transcript_473/g.567 Transcript_473/m.567 type:complete len:219 (-) Transcript_473:149-805(-)
MSVDTKFSGSPANMVSDAKRVPPDWASWLTIDDGRTVEEYLYDKLHRQKGGKKTIPKPQETVITNYGTRQPPAADTRRRNRSTTTRCASERVETIIRNEIVPRRRSATVEARPQPKRKHANAGASRNRARSFVFPGKFSSSKRHNQNRIKLAPKTEALLRAVGAFPPEAESFSNKENHYSKKHCHSSALLKTRSTVEKQEVKKKGKFTSLFRTRKSSD